MFAMVTGLRSRELVVIFVSKRRLNLSVDSESCLSPSAFGGNGKHVLSPLISSLISFSQSPFPGVNCKLFYSITIYLCCPPRLKVGGRVPPSPTDRRPCLVGSLQVIALYRTA